MKKIICAGSALVLLLVLLAAAFPGISAAAQSISVDISTSSNGTVNISGRVAPAGNKAVTVKVVNPDGTPGYLNQTVTDGEGRFGFQYRLQQAQKGVYSVSVNAEGVQSVWQGTFTANSGGSNPGGGDPGNGNPGNGNQGGSGPSGNEQGTGSGNWTGGNGQTGGGGKANAPKSWGAVIALKPEISATNGTNVIVADVSSDLLNEALRQKGWTEEHTITVLVENNAADDVTVRLPAGVLAALAGEHDLNGTINIVTAFGSYRLPLSSLDWKGIAEKAGVGLEALKLEIRIAKADDPLRRKIANLAERINASVKGEMLVFEVAVSSDVTRYAIDSFASYVSRSMSWSEQIDPERSTAVYYDEKSDRLRFAPSTFAVDGGKQSVTIKRRGNSAYAVISGGRSFNDLTSVSWAAADIELLSAKRIVYGVGDSRFEPQRDVTRAEMAELLVNALGLNRGASTEGLRFADVATDAWYADAVDTAYRSGLIAGYNGKFRPDDIITRQELAVMIVRAAQFAGKSAEAAAPEHLLAKYRDVATIADWAKREVSMAVNWGVLNGIAADRIAGDGTATRAQAAVMLARILRMVNFIDA